MGTTSVLKRAFSALCLASMARREARAPFMGAERYHQLVRDSINYLQAERDLRGSGVRVRSGSGGIEIDGVKGSAACRCR
ncbi:MAG TPA: DUF2785 domain-containing protein, partial [Terriglobales bacterium]|nr:DUF2785 domain-containing protein [Terriglobales bacterium]